VKEFSKDEFDFNDDEFIIQWDGQLSNNSYGLDGIYFLTIQNRKLIKTIKLVKVN